MENSNLFLYAFVDDNNMVKVINVFDSQNEELIEEVRIFHNAKEAILCEENSNVGVDKEFYNGKFYDNSPYISWIRNETLGIWEPPIPYPIIEEGSDEVYTWDENTTSWLLLPPSN